MPAQELWDQVGTWEDGAGGLYSCPWDTACDVGQRGVDWGSYLSLRWIGAQANPCRYSAFCTRLVVPADVLKVLVDIAH